MGDSGFELSLGDALPYLEEKLLKMLGKDAATVEERLWLKSLHQTALAQTKSVQCIGMRDPIPFELIYQPTRLRPSRKRKSLLQSDSDFDPEELLSHDAGFSDEDRFPLGDPSSDPFSRAKRTFDSAEAAIEKQCSSREDVIVFGGPGWGKTTFMHHLFRCFTNDKSITPMLLSLRRPTAVADLQRFVDLVERKVKSSEMTRIVLIVDGYDELKLKDRRRVSEALLKFQALHVGNFYLSCRDFYRVIDLHAKHLFLERFSRPDKIRFITAFLKAFSSRLDPLEVMEQFEERGLEHFLSHPLLLGLACIVRTNSQSLQPRSSLRLLERALDALSARWDDQRGIERHPYTPLDGRDRVQILKRIAHGSHSPYLPDARVSEIADRELAFLTYDRIDARQVLLETAQFYGILVPTDDGWEFVHRSLQDYLAAQYSVETGEFARATQYEWSTRTAYAACLMHDSLPVLRAALADDDGLPTATEILSNFPTFDLTEAAQMTIEYFEAQGRSVLLESPCAGRVRGRLSSDFVRSGTSSYLSRLIEICSANRNPIRDLLCGYCLLEMSSREMTLPADVYGKATKAFETENFNFYLVSSGAVTLSSLRPAKTKMDS